MAIGGKKNIKSILDSFIVDHKLQDSFHLEEIKNGLDKIFSEGLKKEIKASSLTRGHLILITDSAAWKEELKLRREELKKKLNKLIEKEIINSIEVK